MYITNAMIAVMMIVPAMLFASEEPRSEGRSTWVYTPSVNDAAVDAGSVIASDAPDVAIGGRSSASAEVLPAPMSAEPRLTTENVRLLESQDDRPDEKMEKGELIQQKRELLEKIGTLEEARRQLSKEIDERDQRLAARGSVIIEHKENIKILEEMLSKKDREINASKQELVDLTEKHEKALAKLAEEKAQALDAKDVEIAGKDVEIEQYNRQLTELIRNRGRRQLTETG